MKKLILLLPILLLAGACSVKEPYPWETDFTETEVSNPWLIEKHIPDENGYLHNLPCHAGESAVTDFSLDGSGCYELNWNDFHEEDIKSGNCYIDSQNVLICSN